MPERYKHLIYLIPFEYIEYRLLNYLSKELLSIFKTDVIFGAKQALPAASYNQYRSQYRASAFLEALQNLKLNGKIIGITNVDIYAPKHDYTFSVADPENKVAIAALTRLQPLYYKTYQDESVFWLRVLKEIIHATARLYGLEHCFRQECVMHASNTIMSIDIKTDRFCGDCRRLLKSAVEQ